MPPRTLSSLVATLAASAALNGAAAPREEVRPAAGPLTATTMQRLLLADAVHLGGRIVAVGDHGYVVFSDDQGLTWKRARTPAAPLLTAVEFTDPRTGFAVGHDSVILATTDAGETWTLRFSAPTEQRPLLDVAFISKTEGFAVGAYGAFYETHDAGKTWKPRKIIEDDKHLNAILVVGEARLLILGETGTILTSGDAGRTWELVPAPYKGSFFGGLVAADGSVIAFGLRGRIFRSTDAGRSWSAVQNPSSATLMGGAKLADGSLAIAGSAGTLLVSRDNGRSVTAVATGTMRAFAKALPGPNKGVLLIGETGARALALPAPAAARR